MEKVAELLNITHYGIVSAGWQDRIKRCVAADNNDLEGSNM
jgi:hypothetical protein